MSLPLAPLHWHISSSQGGKANRRTKSYTDQTKGTNYFEKSVGKFKHNDIVENNSNFTGDQLKENW